ncbi:MAG: cupin domain-containing protein [Planctomycetota bacterium]
MSCQVVGCASNNVHCHKHRSYEHTHDSTDTLYRMTKEDGNAEIGTVTRYQAEHIWLTPGVRIINDVTDHAKVPGVDTLEGRMGPLILTPELKVYYMEMVPGFFIKEHPHSKRMIIYTIKGHWVLCSGGRRHLMRPGSIFHFEPNKPTGYEVPFNNSAYLLIFQEDRTETDMKSFVEGLEGLKVDLEKRRANGMHFFLRELQPNHPAREFARKVNPEWEHKLQQSQQ